MLEAWRFAIRRLLKRPPPWPRDERFLASRHASTVPEHPWFADASAASDGQRAYVGMLMRILPFLDGYDRAFHVPVIAPLLSQPLVEYGLGVPVWQWSAGGHDRSLARKAFAGDLPALVLQRRTKGGLESLFVPAYDRNRAHLRDFLQEGLLAALGIIDCDAIGAATARPAGALDNDYVRILQLVDMERWARSVAGAPTAGGQ
jgi:asparagine synthase (glutamine-hydrolysing)